MRVNKKIIADLANFIQMRYGISIADYQEKYPDFYKSFLRMHYWMDEIVLENYFGNNDKGWKQHDRWKTRKTGQKLLDKIKEISKIKNWNLVRWQTDEDNFIAKKLYDKIAIKTKKNVYELK